ncbi:MAG TPA: hypothetical protein VMF30_07070 [Pirellulales bacterium]|nr:hypothetical protein [Pirellulales bacterium]
MTISLATRRAGPVACCLAGAILLALEGWSAPQAAAAGAAQRSAGTEPSAPRDATFDDIKLDLKKDEPFKRSDLTTKVKDLDGKWIKIRGYILPGFQDTGIKQFVLTRDNMECCFGKGAALHDCVLVEMLDDATTNFTVRPVTVIGKFSVKEVVDADGKQLAIYRLEAREAK